MRVVRFVAFDRAAPALVAPAPVRAAPAPDRVLILHGPRLHLPGETRALLDFPNSLLGCALPMSRATFVCSMHVVNHSAVLTDRAPGARVLFVVSLLLAAVRPCMCRWFLGVVSQGGFSCRFFSSRSQCPRGSAGAHCARKRSVPFKKAKTRGGKFLAYMA